MVSRKFENFWGKKRSVFKNSTQVLMISHSLELGEFSYYIDNNVQDSFPQLARLHKSKLDISLRSKLIRCIFYT